MVLDYDTQIEMLLFDQEKIVTYKEINNRFDITPREAQKVLKKFIDDHHNKSSGKKGQFAVVYLLVLENVDTKKKKLQLVNERDLDTIGDDYKIISKQVYSIQSKPISDFNLIYSSDIDASNSLNRKSNLNVVFSAHEPQQENLMDTGSSHHHEETSKSSSNSSATSTTSSKPGSKPPASEHQVLRPSKESNKPSEPIKEKEHSKEIKVKEEPNEPKKIKLESNETASNIAAVKTGAAQSHAQAKPAAAAKPAAGGKNPPAKQSTLTSFFKKA